MVEIEVKVLDVVRVVMFVVDVVEVVLFVIDVVDVEVVGVELVIVGGPRRSPGGMECTGGGGVGGWDVGMKGQLAAVLLVSIGKITEVGITVGITDLEGRWIRF